MSKLHGMRFYNFKIVCIESTRTKYVRNYIKLSFKTRSKTKRERGVKSVYYECSKKPIN